MNDKLIVKDLFKIFGQDARKALELCLKGLGNDEIYDKTGSVVAVNNASFSVEPGEIFVIMGLSGSGKSTLVRMLNRLIEPTSGSITINDREITTMDRQQLIQLRRSEIGMVFQSFALMPHLTALENAEFGLAVAGISPEERRKRALSALEKVGLGSNAHAYPSELSGGMQQRVGLARALAQDPEVLLMDEAFSALDPLIRTEMQDELLRLQKDDSRTIIFISHDLDEAMRIGDRIAIMQQGRIVQVGTPHEILRNPADDYVRSFFRGVDISRVYTAGDVARPDDSLALLDPGGSVRDALYHLDLRGRDFGYVVDADGLLRGVVTVDSLREALARGEERLDQAYSDTARPVSSDLPLAEILGRVGASSCPVPVVDDTARWRGVISQAALLEAMDRSEG
jgi:glycine betaine/proline transport system ATP-binding protein